MQPNMHISQTVSGLPKAADQIWEAQLGSRKRNSQMLSTSPEWSRYMQIQPKKANSKTH